jgi:hypothetical protein
MESAWISSRMRSPSAAYTNWWRCTRLLPANAGRDDQRLEMLPVTLDLDVLAGEAGLDAGFHAFGADHNQCLSL